MIIWSPKKNKSLFFSNERKFGGGDRKKADRGCFPESVGFRVRKYASQVIFVSYTVTLNHHDNIE